MNTRSSLATVRNPILKLATVGKFKTLPADVKQPLIDLLLELRNECLEKANQSLVKNKYFLFSYWKVCSVYIGHIARAIR